MTKPIYTNVPLDTPIKRGETEIKQIKLRKPASGELRGLSLQDVMSLDVTSLHKLLPRISEPTLTEQEVAALDPADLLELGSEAASFFLSKAKKVEASLPA